MRIRFAAAIGALIAATSVGGVANAGVYGDELGKCIVESVSQKDQNQFILWMFSAMSYHPQVASYAKITDAQRTELATNAGKLMERLLTQDCHRQVVAAIKYEGPSVVEGAFSMLGQVAMRGLMNDPAVQAGLEHLDEGIDDAKIAQLATEAGLPPAK